MKIADVVAATCEGMCMACKVELRECGACTCCDVCYTASGGFVRARLYCGCGIGRGHANSRRYACTHLDEYRDLEGHGYAFELDVNLGERVWQLSHYVVDEGGEIVGSGMREQVTGPLEV